MTEKVTIILISPPNVLLIMSFTETQQVRDDLKKTLWVSTGCTVISYYGK